MTVPSVNLSSLAGLKRNGDVAPAISTKPLLRGGLRGEHPTGRDWKAILEAGANITGTPDPYYDFDSALTYLGAFRIPYINNSTYARSNEIGAMAFNPPNGSNGSLGSLFVGGHGCIAEFEIPTWNTTVTESDVPAQDQTLGGLPLATTMQTFYDIIDQNHLDFDTLDSHPHVWNEQEQRWDPALSDGARRSGWMRVMDGRLVVQYYAYYRNPPTATNTLIFDQPSDLTTTNIQGYLYFGADDKTARYTMPIPPEHQATFGGDDMLSGICTEVAIVSRSSYGHSLGSWDSSVIGANTPSPIPVTMHIDFPQDNAINNFTPTNGGAVAHYAGILGVSSMMDYLDLPKTDRFTSLEGLPLQASADMKHVVHYNSNTCVAFFVPNTDTILMLGWQNGMRYGKVYKKHYIEDELGGYQNGGYGSISRTDHDSVAWAYNVNDVAASQNGHDIDYSDFKVLSHWPWTGNIVAGCVDEANNRLYLIHDGYYWNDYNGERPLVVSVWQINAGSKP